eukprot:11827732-Prorocentrum_lima.AAC.1
MRGGAGAPDLDHLKLAHGVFAPPSCFRVPGFQSGRPGFAVAHGEVPRQARHQPKQGETCPFV